MGCSISKSRVVETQTGEEPKHATAKQDSIRTDTAMPVTSPSNGTSPFSNYLERNSTPSYRLQHEYRGGHKPNDELNRISTLQSLDILDTKPEPKYDDITKLLCSIFNMPIAQLSLVDRNRQWCKSLQGHDMRQIDRNTAFCAWVLLPKHPKALVVEDTLQDARFRDNTLVTGHPFIRFYAGAPLIASNGHRLGSLCVIDRRPRTLDTEQLALLCNFAEMAVREMEKDKLCTLKRGDSLVAEMTADGMHRAAKALTQGLFVVDVTAPGWKVLLMNDQAACFAGVDRELAQGQGIWGLFQLPSSRGRPEDLYSHPISESLEFSVVATSTARQHSLSLTFRPASSDMMDEHMPSIGIPNFVDFMQRRTKSFYFCFVTTVEKGPMPVASPPGTALIESSHAKDLTPFQDVRLGPLVGKGSFGKVYRGIWDNIIVAIKVARYTRAFGKISLWQSGLVGLASPTLTLTGGKEAASWAVVLKAFKSYTPSSQLCTSTELWSQPCRFQVIEHVEQLQQIKETPSSEATAGQDGFQGDTQGQPGSGAPLLEAVLGHGLRHPNVVQTYKYATHNAEVRSEPFADRQSMVTGSLPPSNHGTLADIKEDCSVRSESALHSTGKHMLETWLLLEYCDKGSLQDGIEQGWFRKPQTKKILQGGPDLNNILITAREIAAALAYLHTSDVLHGDLTGNNILLASSRKDKRAFTVKVADFGLSRQASSSTVDTDTYGTVTHMPPELLMEGKLSKAADVYAFGVLLWEMYTGERPFAGMRHAQIIYHVTTLLAHPEFPKDTPPKLKALADSCMHADKEQRPSFDDLLVTLDELQQELSQQEESSLKRDSAPTHTNGLET